MHNSSLFSSVPGLLLLLALVIFASYTGAALIAAFLLLVLFICLCASLWSRSILMKTEVSVGDGQTACYAGETLPITLRVRSRSPFPLIWLDVILPLGHTLIFHREDEDAPALYTLPTEKPLYGLRERFVWLLWQHEISCEETLIASRRGVVPITKVSLQAGDGLGMAASQRFAPLSRPRDAHRLSASAACGCRAVSAPDFRRRDRPPRTNGGYHTSQKQPPVSARRPYEAHQLALSGHDRAHGGQPV